MPTAKRKMSVGVRIALYTLIATIIIGVLTLLWPDRCKYISCSGTENTVRIADMQGKPVQGASVIFFTGAGAAKEISDTDGQTHFTNLQDTKGSRLVVQADDYQIYEQQFSGFIPGLINIRLQPKQGSSAGVVLRLFDRDTGLPVPNAEITILINTYTQSKVTDSNGVVKYDLDFPPSGMLDGQITVKGKGYDFKNETITFYPNKAQDIQISQDKKLLEVGSIQTGNSPSNSDTVSTRTSSAGVIIKSQISQKISPATGFAVTQDSYDSQDKGELQILWVSPDAQPMSNMGTQIFLQKSNVNEQPMAGNYVTDVTTDAGGISKAELKPATYSVKPRIGGYDWTALMYNHLIEAGQSQRIWISPSQIAVMVHRADQSIFTNNHVQISTQKKDANGNSIPDKVVASSYIDSTGIVLYTLTPGRYTISIDGVVGSDWGSADFDLHPATLTTLDIRLGRIQFESRDKDGKALSGYAARITFIKKDVNGGVIPGDSIVGYRSDSGGLINFDLTPGSYLVVSDEGQFQVEIKSGETRIVKNTDMKKP